MRRRRTCWGRSSRAAGFEPSSALGRQLEVRRRVVEFDRTHIKYIRQRPLVPLWKKVSEPPFRIILVCGINSSPCFFISPNVQLGTIFGQASGRSLDFKKARDAPDTAFEVHQQIREVHMQDVRQVAIVPPGARMMQHRVERKAVVLPRKSAAGHRVAPEFVQIVRTRPHFFTDPRRYSVGEQTACAVKSPYIFA